MATKQLSGLGAMLRQIVDRYRSILAERNVALLLGAGVASELGDWFNTVALITLSFHISDSAFGVGGMFAVRMLTRLLLQGPAGALVDRFAKYLSEPPMAYLTRWRLQLAAQALTTTPRGVADIAADVGYESEAAFNRAFKRRFGTPPAQYRREHRSGAARAAAKAPVQFAR